MGELCVGVGGQQPRVLARTRLGDAAVPRPYPTRTDRSRGTGLLGDVGRLGEGRQYLFPEEPDGVLHLLRGDFGKAMTAAEHVEPEFGVLFLQASRHCFGATHMG